MRFARNFYYYLINFIYDLKALLFELSNVQKISSLLKTRKDKLLKGKASFWI